MKRSLKTTMLFPKLFYFFFFAAMSCLFPFLALYYRQIGLTGRQIGLLGGISPLVSLVAAPLWGALADATRQHKKLMLLALVLSVVAVGGLSIAPDFPWLMVAVIAFAFFGAPTMPIVDNTVVELLGEHRSEYGKQRLWGAVGWGLTSPIAGEVIERNGLHWAFYGYFALMGCAILVSLFLPVVQSSIRSSFSSDLRRLLTHRRWLLFLLTVFIGSLGLVFVINFLFLYLSELGATKTLMGVSMTVATMGEVPLWFYADRLLQRWGNRGALAVSMLACFIQGIAYSLLRAPWLAIPIQLLQGPAFSTMWAAGVSYAAEVAPPGLRTTAQGMFTGVVMGLRAGLGAFVGGVLYDAVGAAMMFRLGGALALVGLLILALTDRTPSERQAESRP
ncbi:MAG: MFS transporter [Anaerolineae bacterium]|nr:MFS transporter [Anaerolineae bacterium]